MFFGDLKKQNTVFATGKSILDRSCKTNVGELMLAYHGGGHQAAGTCQVENAEAEATLETLIQTINNNEEPPSKAGCIAVDYSCMAVAVDLLRHCHIGML